MKRGSSIIIAPENPGTETIRVPVLKVFDGDGFLTRISGDEFTGNHDSENRVAARFGFVDAPELEQPGGIEAKEFLVALIAGRWLELAVLIKMDTGKIVDRHGRIVCVPFLTEEYLTAEFRTSSDDLHSADLLGGPLLVTRNIELEMVLNGWAWVVERYGPDERYFDALADAQRHRRGIWAQENNIPPWEFKRLKHREARSRLPIERTSCPMEGCHGYLVERSGKFGAFFGCSKFPTCKYTCSGAI